MVDANLKPNQKGRRGDARRTPREKNWLYKRIGCDKFVVKVFKKDTTILWKVPHTYLDLIIEFRRERR